MLYAKAVVSLSAGEVLGSSITAVTIALMSQGVFRHMSVPFSSQQCFFVAILAFIVIGFIRGWRRELVSLVFVLLAAVLIRPGTNNTIGQIIARIPSTLGYLAGSPNTSTTGASSSSFLGPWGTLLIFALVVILGYFVGNKAFPKPATPAERFIGVIPGVISGAFIMAYLVSSGFFGSRPSVDIVLTPPDPSNYVAIIFVIVVAALIIALIASRTKKAPAKK